MVTRLHKLYTIVSHLCCRCRIVKSQPDLQQLLKPQPLRARKGFTSYIHIPPCGLTLGCVHTTYLNPMWWCSGERQVGRKKERFPTPSAREVSKGHSNGRHSSNISCVLSKGKYLRERERGGGECTYLTNSKL